MTLHKLLEIRKESRKIELTLKKSQERYLYIQTAEFLSIIEEILSVDDYSEILYSDGYFLSEAQSELDKGQRGIDIDTQRKIIDIANNLPILYQAMETKAANAPIKYAYSYNNFNGFTFTIKSQHYFIGHNLIDDDFCIVRIKKPQLSLKQILQGKKLPLNIPFPFTQTNPCQPIVSISISKE